MESISLEIAIRFPRIFQEFNFGSLLFWLPFHQKKNCQQINVNIYIFEMSSLSDYLLNCKKVCYQTDFLKVSVTQ